MGDDIIRLQKFLYVDVWRLFSTLGSPYTSETGFNLEIKTPGNGRIPFPQSSPAKAAIERRSRGSPTLCLREHKRHNPLSIYQLSLSGTRVEM